MSYQQIHLVTIQVYALEAPLSIVPFGHVQHMQLARPTGTKTTYLVHLLHCLCIATEVQF